MIITFTFKPSTVLRCAIAHQRCATEGNAQVRNSSRARAKTRTHALNCSLSLYLIRTHFVRWNASLIYFI